jgi:hypothetical protein
MSKPDERRQNGRRDVVVDARRIIRGLPEQTGDQREKSVPEVSRVVSGPPKKRKKMMPDVNNNSDDEEAGQLGFQVKYLCKNNHSLNELRLNIIQ